MKTKERPRLMVMAKRMRGVIGAALIWSLIYGFMVGVASLVSVRGSDWYLYFQPRREIYDYPPFLLVVLALLPSLPFLSGLTLTIMLAVLWRRRARYLHFMAVFTAMPLYWTLWMGQIDAVPMLGLAFLPWSIPLSALKPQLTVWYLWPWWRRRLDKWKIALGVLAFLALTVVIWGWWFLRWRPPASIVSIYNLSLWNVWWPLGLIALIGAVYEPDPDRAMALGALAAPYVGGNNYLLLLPTFTCLSGWPLALAWLTSWAGAVTLVFGNAARPLNALFPLSLWVALTWEARRRSATKDEN
jgi:hypothetical protein